MITLRSLTCNKGREFISSIRGLYGRGVPLVLVHTHTMDIVLCEFYMILWIWILAYDNSWLMVALPHLCLERRLEIYRMLTTVTLNVKEARFRAEVLLEYLEQAQCEDENLNERNDTHLLRFTKGLLGSLMNVKSNFCLKIFAHDITSKKKSSRAIIPMNCGPMAQETMHIGRWNTNCAAHKMRKIWITISEEGHMTFSQRGSIAHWHTIKWFSLL
ncbi:unnamed protein product [Thelazia callipaeda]|uniref:Reverse transcriptase n=1 Tax=Thelazia callipaeda TaxID=103827 RepID=A0A0N5DBC7_THECL|nr:unnamed protein product [Thelazia callipaeda]